MEGHFYKPNCKCPKDAKKCTCGATWSYILDIGIDPETGKRKQKKKGGFKTKKAATLAAAIVMQELDQGTFVQESDITFEKFGEEWLVRYAKGTVKESTVRVRKHEIGRLLTYLAQIKIKNITRKRYQDALNELKEQGLARTTIEGIHVTGRMIFKNAIKDELIKKDPSEYAIVPRTVKTVEELEAEDEIVKYLEKDELSVFLNMAKNKGLDKDYPVFLLLAYTGMRVGEMCALKWKDIDFVEGTVNITKTYYNPTNNVKMYKLLPPKTITSKRKISIDEVVLEELKKHKAKQNIAIMEKRNIYYDHDFVFTKQAKYLGYPEIIKTIEYRMHRLLRIAKLNVALTPHSLRHTHTSLLAEAEVSLPEIMERLGHKDDKTTKQVYMHTTKTMKKKASQKFSELMKSL